MGKRSYCAIKKYKSKIESLKRTIALLEGEIERYNKLLESFPPLTLLEREDELTNLRSKENPSYSEQLEIYKQVIGPMPVKLEEIWVEPTEQQ